MNAVVDLRSDTVTRPTPAMRDAIARAVVGDDALGDDPTTRALEERVAVLLGKPAAVFFPSGTMANETGLQVLAGPGTEAIMEASCHFFDWEMGGPAALGGIQPHPVAAPDGRLTADLVARAIRPGALLQVRTGAICLENTHNAAGGRVLPLATMAAIRDLADQRGIPIHLDGARLWNASAASGIPEREFAATADTVMVALSKGLGCPVGSLLAGSQELMQRARAVRRRLGGAMRQSGILAAAGLYALDHHRDRLRQDHQRAHDLAAALSGLDGCRVIEPETNIVMIDITRPEIDATMIVTALAQHDVLLSEFTPTRVRAVTHLDVDDHAIQTAAAAFRTVLDELIPPASG